MFKIIFSIFLSSLLQYIGIAILCYSEYAYVINQEYLPEIGELKSTFDFFQHIFIVILPEIILINAVFFFVNSIQYNNIYLRYIFLWLSILILIIGLLCSIHDIVHTFIKASGGGGTWLFLEEVFSIFPSIAHLILFFCLTLGFTLSLALFL